jgi:hypothetical protein
MTMDTDLKLLLDKVERLAGEVDQARAEFLAIQPANPQKERLSAQYQSRVAIKLLLARRFLEEMAALEPQGLTLNAAQTLLFAQTQVNLAAEARFVYEHYLKGARQFQLDARVTLLTQFELCLAFLRNNDVNQAEEIFAEMAPPDGGDDLYRVLGTSLFLFLELCLKTEPKRAFQRYLDLSRLFPQIPENATTQPTSRLVKSEPSLVYSSRPSPKTPLDHIMARHFPFNYDLLNSSAEVLAALIGQAAIMLVENLAVEPSQLRNMYKTLDVLPKSAATEMTRAQFLIAAIQALDPTGWSELAYFFLIRLLNLPSPELDPQKAQGLLATIACHGADPNLKKAERLLSAFDHLSSTEQTRQTKIKAMALLSGLYQAHGHLEKARQIGLQSIALGQSPQDDEAIADALLAGLSGSLRANRGSESLAIFENILNLSPSPKINAQKARAALMMISQSALTQRPDLAVRFFHSLTQIGDTGAFADQFTHALSAISRTLAQDGRLDQMELYLKTLDALNVTNNHLEIIKAYLRIELINYYLSRGEEAKVEPLAQKIESGGPESRTAQARLELMFIRRYGILADLNKAMERLTKLRHLGAQPPELLTIRGEGLVTMAAIAGERGELSITRAMLKELEILAARQWPEQPELLTMTANLYLLTLVLTITSNHRHRYNQDREIVETLFSKAVFHSGWGPFQGAALRGVVIFATSLIDLNKMNDALALTERLTGRDQSPLTKARIYLLIIKRLVGLKRAPQAEPMTRDLEALAFGPTPDPETLDILGEALFTLARAFAKAGRIFPQFTLERPLRPNRHKQPEKTTVDRTANWPLSPVFCGMNWLKKILYLPDLGHLPLWKQKTCHQMIVALLDRDLVNQAKLIFRRLPWPTLKAGYDIVKTRLNSAFILLEALSSTEPLAAVEIFAELAEDYLVYVERYYLRDLGKLGLALKQAKCLTGLDSVEKARQAMTSSLAQSYLRSQWGDSLFN